MKRIGLTFLLLAAAWAVADDAAGQSLWQRGRGNHVALIADNRAHNIGDVISIVVEERQKVENKENVKQEKESSGSYELLEFQPYDDLGDELIPVLWDAERDFEGKADFKKEGTFSAQLGAVVVDVQPNGNLVIEGKRNVVIDGENKCMTVSGIVRPFDVASDNTVPSYLVANGKVEYESTGPLDATTSKSWLERFFDWILPF